MGILEKTMLFKIELRKQNCVQDQDPRLKTIHKLHLEAELLDEEC